jgi:hypothetical protein
MEWKRQTVHMLAGFLIVLLRFVPYWGILCVSLFGILFNLFFLPRMIPSIMRNTSGDRRGVVFYPVAVTSLLILFPNDLAIVGAWAILLRRWDGHFDWPPGKPVLSVERTRLFRERFPVFCSEPAPSVS